MDWCVFISAMAGFFDFKQRFGLRISAFFSFEEESEVGIYFDLEFD